MAGQPNSWDVIGTSAVVNVETTLLFILFLSILMLIAKSIKRPYNFPPGTALLVTKTYFGFPFWKFEWFSINWEIVQTTCLFYVKKFYLLWRRSSFKTKKVSKWVPFRRKKKCATHFFWFRFLKKIQFLSWPLLCLEIY